MDLQASFRPHSLRQGPADGPSGNFSAHSSKIRGQIKPVLPRGGGKIIVPGAKQAVFAPLQFVLDVGDNLAVEEVNGNPLLLTAGELLREMLGAVADGHALHDFRDLLLALTGRYVQVPQRQLNVLIHIEFVNQVETLEHKADVALAELGALLLLEATHFCTEEFIRAAGGIVQQAQDVQQRVIS